MKPTYQELELAQRLDNLERIFDFSLDMIGEGNLSGYFTRINSSFGRILGYTDEEFLAVPFLEFIHHEDVEKTEEALAAAARGQKEIFIENRYKCKNELFKWIEWKVLAIVQEDRFIAVGRDTTERKWAEKELIDTKQSLELLLATSAAVVYRCDLAKNYPATFITDNIKEILGYEPEDFLKNSDFWASHIHPEDSPRVFAELPTLLKKGSHVHEYRFLHKDGSYRWMLDHLRLIKNAEGNPQDIIGTFIDITERKQIEQDLQRIKQLESIGILAGGIAHDFNNMLTAILGNIDLAQLNLSPKEKVYEILENAKNASMQAQNLTQQLLTFSRGGEPVKRQINLKKLLYDSVTLSLSGSSVKCEYRIADELWPIKADEGQISQVFSNVLLNALQSMPEGGVVTIRAENITIEPEEQPQLLSGKYVKISVTDQGLGIPTKYFTKVFDPYFSTKQAGSGLGLAICHSIISKHKGYINVESTFGIGTTINVYLSASAKKETLVETKAQFKSKDGSDKILIMDDEEIVRIVASDMLEHLGYKPYTARDGAEAIALYKRAMKMARPFDAVIMDLTIRGGMGGKSAIKKLLKIDLDAKVIVSSGYSNDPIMADFQSYGFSGVISKPYKVFEVSEVLKKILQKES